ncbi:hypothetical protein Moror_219 [Moniliophthora roreri MCA 2997]|uniref:Uncharacterized protein n=1 Tax=Moniliophthora roreri (strain MCA 2997) TaxID=1381753 RepID=V2Z3B1_MONRO|nr:hypothetical protein Moror_219 [Moniliophthora roreri MCA 2997]
MANTDIAAGVSTGSSGTQDIKSEGLNHVVDLTSEAATEGPDTHPATQSTTPTPNSKSATSLRNTASSEAASIQQATRPTLVPLGSASAQGPSPAPQPKRFSAVNINKKFLEKNGPNSTTTPIASAFNSLKSGSTIPKPAVTSSTSHPRLITTKLTATPQLSSSPGPGWSRPSSVTPPVANSNATTPNGSSHPIQNPSTKTANNAVSGPPQPPAPGKVIQPQPRAATATIGLNKSSSGTLNRPAWANMRPAAGTTRAPSSDFPTAAEVAKGVTGRVSKAAELKDMEEASKQARMEEADTFRGVHLDPNAHHWDEMEEDDDNFLDGVIEFGDGRQYKVDAPSSPPEGKEASARSSSRFSSKTDDSTAEISSVPVSKEERFVDDFDRSWPRSGPSSNIPGRGSNASDPSLSSHSQCSPQESSRVLFNERSNRLEPYNGSSRSTQGPFKRGHQPDPPNDTRGSRSSPTHTSGNNHNFQLLQKLPNKEGSSQNRRYSSGGGAKALEGEQRDRSRQQSSMPPPPVPLHALRGKESGRQLPPHLSQSGNASTPFERRAPSRESRRGSQTTHAPGSPSAASSVRQPSQSPALSHRSLAPVSSSPIVDPAVLGVSADELENAKKDLMHTAAARAKQRRQQEEEEREREKERARQKALELEQRIAAEKEKEQPTKKPKQTKEEIVVQDIEDAIKTANSDAPSDSTSQVSGRPGMQRHASTRSISSQGHDRSLFGRRSSVSSRISTGDAPSFISPSTSAESWRSRANPLPTPKITTHGRTHSLASQPPSALDQVQSLAEDPNVEFEIVDYSDLGKFVGDQDNETALAAEPHPPKGNQRAVASDFFGEETPAVDKEPLRAIEKPDDRVWRKITKPTVSIANGPPESRTPVSLPEPAPASELSQKEEASALYDSHHLSAPTSTSHPVAQRRQPYKEPTMSALDDAMSRIRGAIVGMQGENRTSAESESRRSAIPSSVKASSQKDSHIVSLACPRQIIKEPSENFLYTSSEPPRSPKPAWNAFVVKVPKTSVPLEPVHKRRMFLFNKVMPVRWEILSFTPPVEGMSRRDFSLNDVLFRRQYGYGYKGKMKYKVSLPRSSISPLVPKVNIPSHHNAPSRSNTTGAFGKPTAADGASTWRKRSALSTETTAGELDTTSRSPPPEPAVAEPIMSPGKLKEEALSPTMTLSRLRSQPKMPAGSGVAFYRDSRVIEIDSQAKSAVSFFAVNDSDAPNPEKAEARSDMSPSSNLANGIPSVSGLGSASTAGRPSDAISPSSSKYSLPPLVSSKAESKSSEDSPDRLPITPPHTGASWSRTSLSLPGKDSSVRAPDPEHLKAVWSQPSNKSDLHPVNSLEGIADDLTALPFTLLDVKSEDGETPPPTLPTAPSRMSLHDVTRAFQQVPTSSSSSSGSHRPTISPPSTTAPVARPPQGYNYSTPNASTPNVRPNYQYHPSPMMSHSPAPAMYHPMNGSPVPSRMAVNGHTPMYSPVWMPLPNPASQTPNPMMRPGMPSPYPPVMYPSPGPQTMYPMPPNMQNAPGQSQVSPHGTMGRGRGNPPMMSPAMQHAGAIPPMPMYTGSPVMMPAHAGRPPLRNDNGHHPSVSQLPPSHPQPQHYPSVHGPSFNIRPSW